MNRWLFILGIITVLVYSMFYHVVFTMYEYLKENPDQFYLISDISNVLIYGCISLIFFILGRNEQNRNVRLFIYYAIAEFWGLISLQILYCKFIYNPITFHKVLIALLTVLLINIITWLLRSYLQYTKR